MNIHSISPKVTSYFTDHILRPLTAQQQKILLIATFILGCLAAIYAFKNWNSQSILKASLFTGHGSFTSPTGDIVEGEFKDGMLHGQAKVIRSDGEIWEGEYKKNQMDGPGKKTYLDGTQEEGIFKNGILIPNEDLKDVKETKDLKETEV